MIAHEDTILQLRYSPDGKTLHLGPDGYKDDGIPFSPCAMVEEQGIADNVAHRLTCGIAFGFE